MQAALRSSTERALGLADLDRYTAPAPGGR